MYAYETHAVRRKLIRYCKGVGSWRTTSRTTSPLGGNRRKGEKKRCLAGLSSYLCRLCPMCQSVQARGSYPPHHSTHGEMHTGEVHAHEMDVHARRLEMHLLIMRSGLAALTARLVRYGRRTRPHLRTGPSPGIKTHSSPAAFPTTLSLTFVPFPLSPFCNPPSRASGRAELHLLPCQAS